MHSGQYVVILTLGALLLIGLLTQFLSRKIPLPRVTILIICGVLAGSSLLDVLPRESEQWYPLVSRIALILVAFLLGAKFSLKNVRERGSKVLVMSVAEVAGAAALVFAGVYFLCGRDLVLALLLAGIAPASAPAAIVNVVHELKAQGDYTETLLGIVAIDDAWGIMVFSILLAAAQTVSGGGGALDALAIGGWEVGGAILLGLVLGIPATWLTGRIRGNEPMQAEALGFVLVCGGLALWLEVSFLLAPMVMGAVITNFARHHDAPFEAVEKLEWPVMILFFILAGASLHVENLAELGLVGAAYVAFRFFGLMLGSYVGGAAIRAGSEIRRWMGLAVLPQAGVALGLALVAGQTFPEMKEVILPLIIGSTVVFELAGPVLARYAIVRVGEAGNKGGKS